MKKLTKVQIKKSLNAISEIENNLFINDLFNLKTAMNFDI
jgi:hypothetical protein